MYSYKTGLGQVWVGSKLPPNPANNIIWLRPSDDHRVLWEIRTYNIYKEKWEVLTSAALTAEGLLVLIRDLEKDVKSLQELKAVLYDTVQNLTPEQQQIARQNIGAVSLEDLPLDENVTRLAIELTINDENVYSVVTPLETLTEHYRKFLADPTKYVWQLYLKVGEDQLGLVPLFIINYGGLHIGFYSPDMSGETKYVSLNTNGDVVIRATVNNYGPTLVEVVQSTGDSVEKVMSQKTVTEELRKKASMASVTEGISAHNTSSISHADIRELLNTCVGLPAYDSSSYKITFTTLAGANVEIDLPIEQLALRYNPETESIEFDNADGTTTSIPVSAFVKEYVGSIGDRIQISIDENNVIHATILKNSIDWDCLSLELQERINDHVTSADFATKVVRTDIAQSLSLAAQNQAFKNLGWKVHVISESAIGSSDAVSDDEKAARLAATALLVQETGLLYNFSISSGGSRRFYGQFSNSFCTALNVNEATGVITSSFAYLYDPSAVSFNRDQSSVSDDNKNKALGNIGIDLVRLPYSLLGTTLSDKMANVIDNAKGIILVNTPSDYTNPLVFIKGNNVSGSCIFVSFVTGNTYSIFTLNKSTKLLSGISSGLTYGGSVRYAEEQSLTTAQQERALDNIGFPLVHLDFALIGTTLDDNIYNAVASAKGIILENVPDGNNAPSLYLVGNSDTVTTIFVSEFNARVWFVLTLSHTSKKLSLISTGYATDVVRYSEGQNLTNTQKDMALSNIGLNFINVDYSLLGTTLDDSTAALVENANGLILFNVPNNERPVILPRCSFTNNVVYFNSWRGVYLVDQITYNVGTKALSAIWSTEVPINSVKYNEVQNLTDTQKQRARANINAVGSSMIKGVEIVYGTAPMQEDNILYIELEETT